MPRMIQEWSMEKREEDDHLKMNLCLEESRKKRNQQRSSTIQLQLLIVVSTTMQAIEDNMLPSSLNSISYTENETSMVGPKREEN
jgi:hypothetical protein